MVICVDVVLGILLFVVVFFRVVISSVFLFGVVVIVDFFFDVVMQNLFNCHL